MASEVGGQNTKLNIFIGGTNGDTPNNDDQFNEISQFLGGFYNESIFNTTSGQGGFQQNITADTGRTFVAFGTANPQGVAKFNGSQDGVVGTNAATEIKGGSGDNDIIITDNASHTVRLGGGDDFLQNTGTGSVTVLAGSGNDAVVGGSGNDSIKGQGGNDFLQGRAGDDTILGGAGADTIVGGLGNDLMTGNGGKDVFLIANEATGKDTITDFKKGDILQIADRNADGKVTFGGATDDVTVTQQGKDTLLTFADGDSVLLKNVNSDKLIDDKVDGQFHI